MYGLLFFSIITMSRCESPALPLPVGFTRFSSVGHFPAFFGGPHLVEEVGVDERLLDVLRLHVVLDVEDHDIGEVLVEEVLDVPEDLVGRHRAELAEVVAEVDIGLLARRVGRAGQGADPVELLDGIGAACSSSSFLLTPPARFVRTRPSSS